METLSTGAGLGALGFWVFVAATVAVGVWDSIRKRDAQHETLRRVIESGQPIDEDLTDKLLHLTGGNRNLDRDLWISGLLMLSIAPALAAFGWLLSITLTAELLPILSSVAALIACLGVGFLLVSRLIGRWDAQHKSNGFD